MRITLHAIQMNLNPKDLLKKVAPDILDLPMDRAILKLRIQLNNAQKDGILFDKLTEELEPLKKRDLYCTKKTEKLDEQAAKVNKEKVLLKFMSCELEILE